MAPQPRKVALTLDLQWPYKRHSEIFAGIQRYAQERGWITIIDEFPDQTLQRNRSSACPYDGIVARVNRRTADRARRSGIPIVNVWPSSPVHGLVPGVFPDSTAVGRLIVEHLLARGFRRFAAVTSPKNVDNTDELREMDRLVRSAGFDFRSTMVPQDPYRDATTWRRTERLIRKAMAHWQLPVGVYVAQEVTGRLVVQLCGELGLRIPDDVAIVAGKNQETLCEQPRPSLTSVEIGYHRIGYSAAELLDRLMNGESVAADPIRLPPEGLVVRESTDFFAVDNRIVASALAYISANSHRTITPNDVGRAVGIETRTLQNYFQQCIRRPIAREIRRVRIERAKRELAQSDRTLSAVARDVGFGTIQRLYEVFRREVGVAPGEYRRQLRPTDRGRAV